MQLNCHLSGTGAEGTDQQGKPIPTAVRMAGGKWPAIYRLSGRQDLGTYVLCRRQPQRRTLWGSPGCVRITPTAGDPPAFVNCGRYSDAHSLQQLSDFKEPALTNSEYIIVRSACPAQRLSHAEVPAITISCPLIRVLSANAG
jgi:hypothetical protein